MKYCPVCEKTYDDRAEVCAVDGAALRQSDFKDDLLVGKIIKGRYRVLERLGEGGMGTVYLAEQVSINRKVALKVLHADYARDEEFVRRFRQEAKLAASLNHHNVVTVFDFDQADDASLYIVMEYVDGRSLGDLIAEGPLTVGRALQLGIQIADGLNTAHRAGVIHRDIKPENIMVVGAGTEIKLMDFGIARLRDTAAAPKLTRPGMIMGTPAYMAPEQIEGGELSERTDIYAFGIVLYEMLTGAVPFKAPTPGAILMQHLQDAPLPLREVRKEIPSSLERIVLKALQKNPDKRLKSMEEVVEALKRAQWDSEKPRRPGGASIAQRIAEARRKLSAMAIPLKHLRARTSSAKEAAKQEGEINFTGQPSTRVADAATVAAESEGAVAEAAPKALGELAGATPEESDARATPLRPLERVERDEKNETVMADTPLSATVVQTIGNEPIQLVPSSPVALPAQKLVAPTDAEEKKLGESADAVRSGASELEPGPQKLDRPEEPKKGQTVRHPDGDTVAETVALSQSIPRPSSERRKNWFVAAGVSGVIVLIVSGVAVLRYRTDPSRPMQRAKTAGAMQDVAKTGGKIASAIPPAGGEAHPVTEDAPPESRTPSPKFAEKIAAHVDRREAKASGQTTTNLEKVRTSGLSKEVPGQSPPSQVAAVKPREVPLPAPVPDTRLVGLLVLADKKEVKVRERVVLTVKGKYSDGKENEIVGGVRWESSNTNVAFVNSRGELEGRNEGAAQITARYADVISPGYTFTVKGTPEAQKMEKPSGSVQDLRRKLLR